MRLNSKKYVPFPIIDLKDREWPNKTIKKSPIWCSVDLRDGNQALIEPMNARKKLILFKKLVDIGFKEIEVGFPSASETDFNFVRELIENKLIPNDVTIQVLTQARENLIEKTIKSLLGCENAIIHLYNSTSTLQRRVVFKKDKKGVKEIAINGAKFIKAEVEKLKNSNIKLQYSPESFTGTELPYALEVCEDVLDVWNASKINPVIINLPATVEMSTPNIYADQIEWMSRNFSDRNRLILSVHPHNDRGTGIAATELSILAGADRVEGTLFGNGERTGNVDIVTLGLNLFTQGVDPSLNFSNLNDIKETAEHCTNLSVHERHPYAGLLVHTAFSGSHQDAIRKGMEAISISNSHIWEVPYLPIDPADIGRTYEAIIRVNSQSGKGGTSWLLEKDHQIKLPRNAEIEFSKIIQQIADDTGEEISSAKIWKIFKKNYIIKNPIELLEFNSKKIKRETEEEIIEAVIAFNGNRIHFISSGNGPISAFVNGIRDNLNIDFSILDFGQNTRSATSTAEASAYVELRHKEKNISIFGCGISTSITMAPILAVVSAVNKFLTYNKNN